MAECNADGTKKETGATLQDATLKTRAYQQSYLLSNLNNILGPLTKNQNPSKYLKLLVAKNKTDALVNRVTVSPDVIAFFDGRPIDYSQLVPHIAIYKVYIKNRKEVSEVLFPFDARTDFEQMKPRNFLKSPFRGTDAGIESVDLKMEGKGRNPVSMNIMQLTIKLVFNDIKTLFRPLNAGIGTTLGGSVQYSDLMRYSPKQLGPGADPRSLPAAFRIRLSLGWNVKNDNAIFKDQGLFAGNNFLDAVTNSKINFIGDLWSHTMEFLEDGSVKVTLKYMGALENSFKTGTADLLKSYSIDGVTTINEIKEKLRADELTMWHDAVSENGAASTKLNNVLKIKNDAKKLQSLIKTMKDKLKSSEQQTYIDAKEPLNKEWKKYIKAKGDSTVIDTPSAELNNAASAWGALSGMEKTAQKDQETAQGKADQIGFKAMGGPKSEEAKQWVAELQKKRKEATKLIQTIEAQLRAKHLFSYVIKLIEANKVAWLSTKTDAFQSFLHYRLQHDEASTKTQQELIAKEMNQSGNAVSTNEIQQVDSNTGEKIEQTNIQAGQIVTYNKSDCNLFLSEEYIPGDKVMFFLLGDLISVILEYANFGESLETLVPDFRILFGNFDYHPLGSDQLHNESLYNLPISLKLFENFIATKIVGTGKQAYLLMDFIEDLIQFIMNKIVGGSSADGAANINPVENSFKLDITPIDLPKKLIKSDVPGKVHRNNTVDVDKLRTNSRGMTAPQLSNTFLIHAYKTQPFKERVKNSYTGDRIKDRKEGIFHFLVGGPNRGLLKKITFQEMSNPKHALAIFEKAQSGGIDSKRGIIKPSMFGCELTLVGNPYFLIGQQFYVNTSLISENNFAKEMMMNGGYYMVTAVESHFGTGKWETKVKGILTVADSVLKKAKKEAPIKVWDETKRQAAAAWEATGLSDPWTLIGGEGGRVAGAGKAVKDFFTDHYDKSYPGGKS